MGMAFYWNDAPTTTKSVPAIPTPHLDKLRKEGAVFARAYTTSPMCAPSRYSVLTGRYPSRCKHAQDRTTSCSSSSILDDPLIVFIHDHGAIGKGTLYETGARIAMFARYPNYVANGGTGTNPFAAETFHD